MKTVLIARTVALLCICMQALHAIPMPNGVSDYASTSENQTGSAKVVSSSRSSGSGASSNVGDSTSTSENQTGSTKVVSSSGSSGSGASSNVGDSTSGQVTVKTEKTTSTTSSNGGQSDSVTVHNSSSGGQESQTGAVGGQKTVTTTKTTSTSTSSGGGKIGAGQNGSTTVVNSSSHGDENGEESHTASGGGQVITTKTTSTPSDSGRGKFEVGQSGSTTVVKSDGHSELGSKDSADGEVTVTKTSTSTGSGGGKNGAGQSGSTTVVKSSSLGDENYEESLTASGGGQVITTKTTSTSSDSGRGKFEVGQSGSPTVVKSDGHSRDSADGEVKATTTSTSSSNDGTEIDGDQSGATTVVNSSSGGDSEHVSEESHTDSEGGHTIVTTTKTTSTSGGSGKGTYGHSHIDDDDEDDHNHYVGHYDYEITDEELELLDSEEIIRKSTAIHSSRNNDCEEQKKRLNNDNDHITRQLQSANKDIVTLTEEKNWFLSELEQCRDDNECISNDFETTSYEIRIVKKKLQKATDDYGKLQTELNKVSSESQSWKSKYEVSSLTLKQAQDNNLKYERTIKESTTTITTLQTTIEQMKVVNKHVVTELDEWKQKYDSENTKVNANEETIKNLNTTIADLNKKNSELAENLSSSQAKSHEYSVEIDTLKTDMDCVKEELSNCHVENALCSDALQVKIKEYNDDEIGDMEEELVRGRLQVQLAECESRYEEIKHSYEIEKALVLSCNNDIVLIHEDCAKTNKQYEEDLEALRNTSQGSIDKCETSLQAEVVKNDEIATEIKSLKDRINDIEYNLSISIKKIEEANTKSKQYQDETIVLKLSIESLKVIISDTTTQLTTCGTHSVSLQNELTSFKSNLEQCTAKLSETEKKLSDDETKISQLNAEIAALRCNVNQYLEQVEAYDQSARKAALEIVSIYEGSKTLLGEFVKENDIHCEVCEDCEACEDEIVFLN